MAHLATKRFNYWGQLVILIAFTVVGFAIGFMASLIPLLAKMNLSDLNGISPKEVMENIIKPENANAIRWMQFISTLFLFFLPAVMYAMLCHQKPFLHLGFKNKMNLRSAGVVVLIMMASLFVVGTLQDITEMLPWSRQTLARFKEAEESYNKMVMIVARMDSFSEYLITVIVIAFLPAVFEETLFRGALQNLFSRWFKLPVLAIVVTSIIFSAFHGSYLGFLSRFALGFIIGWIYYRTSNLWLCIIAHFFNNAFAATYMYMAGRNGQKVDPAKLDDHYPLWMGFLAIGVVYALFLLFEKTSKEEIDKPGNEVIIPGTGYGNNPFSNDAVNTGKAEQY